MNRTLYHRYRAVAFSGGLALVLFASCSKSKSEGEENPKVTETTDVAAKTDPKAEPVKADAEAEAKKAADVKKVAEAIAKLETDVAAERERWTEELAASAKTLATAEYGTAKEALAALAASSHRKPTNIARDGDRHPAETLEFFGLKPDSSVVEMGIGGGWYTEFILPMVANKGQYVGGAYDAEGPKDSMLSVYGMRQVAFLGMNEDLYGKAKTFDLGAEKLVIGEPESADLVVAMREMHNWQRRGSMDDKLKAVIAVLKPGGSFGVVQHRAKADGKAEETAEQGYLPEAWVIEKVEAAGLRFVEKSEINANEKDTKDYPDGVWTLPPSFRQGDTDREKYAAIGESDRMTLRFEKPKAE
tara:strand:- start:32766 stop:33842 length:1077 start_codon:yes stop_codon:yes gene_type:complete